MEISSAIQSAQPVTETTLIGEIGTEIVHGTQETISTLVGGALITGQIYGEVRSETF
jgi:hypothetical protein